MPELGNVQDMTHNINIAAKIYDSNVESKKTAESKKVVSDAVVAEIRNPVSESQDERKDYRQNIQALLSLGQSMRESILEFRKRMAELKQQADEMVNGRFTAGNLAKNYKDQIEDVLKFSTDPTHPVYSDAGEKLAKLREEIQAIISYDGFLIGVHDKIEEIVEQTEFTLEQIPEVLENISQRHKSLELDRFSLTRIHEDVLKALRCQANVSGDRALKLLEKPD